MTRWLLLAGTTALLVVGASASAQDSDGDGVLDPDDNCLLIPNPDQRDTNLDGFGNICDPDVYPPVNDGVIGISDHAELIGAWATTTPPSSPDLDFDGDGVVGMPEQIIYRRFFPSGVPGPSGLSCAGTVPCP